MNKLIALFKIPGELPEFNHSASSFSRRSLNEKHLRGAGVTKEKK